MLASTARRGRFSGSDDDDNDDDDFAPSTPNTVRHRQISLSQHSAQTQKSSQTSATKKRTLSSQSLRKPLLTTKSSTTTTTTISTIHESDPPGSIPRLISGTGGEGGGRGGNSSKNPVVTNVRSIFTNRGPTRNVAPQKQGPTVDAFLTPSPPSHRMLSTFSKRTLEEKPTAFIVLDSESEVESDTEKSNELTVSKERQDLQKIGGIRVVAPVGGDLEHDLANEDPPPDKHQSAVREQTQESIISSQGSVDYTQPNQGDRVIDIDNSQHNEDHEEDHYSTTHWSMSPEITNPYLSDLVAAPPPPSSPPPMYTLPIPGSSRSVTATSMAASSSSIASDHNYNDDPLTMSTFHELSTPRDTQMFLERTECMICGKDLSHLNAGRMAFHVNACIDEQQLEKRAIESLDLGTSAQETSAIQGEFAGARVDYLARVKNCPICLKVWPMKPGKKANKKARLKVEHVKSCAKLHKKSIQSVLYQMRLIKEKYERSLMLGTAMESDDQEDEEEAEEGGDGETAVNDRPENGLTANVTEQDTLKAPQRSKSAMGPLKKAKQPSTVMKQIVSFSDTADADFISDAIITTVHAPTPTITRPNKQARMARLFEDQGDEGLQLALAISMSIEDSESRSGSPLQSGSGSGNRGGVATKWAMVPISDKRRKRSGREMNETTILPYAEIQELIQANVTALLFPEEESDIKVRLDDNTGLPLQPASNKNHCGLKTPPWRVASRISFVEKSSMAGKDSATASDQASEFLSCSQSSDSDTLPKPSLWDLSHLKDASEDISALQLDDAVEHGCSSHSVIESNKEKGMEQKAKDLETEAPTAQENVKDSLKDDQYVTRFMRRFLQQARSTENIGSNTADNIDAGTSVSPWTFQATYGRPGNDLTKPSLCPEKNNSKDKFTSPLWSVAKHRRLSMLKNCRKRQREAEEDLDHELRKHLYDLEEQVQQAKRDAQAKILSSLEKYNARVRTQKSRVSGSPIARRMERLQQATNDGKVSMHGSNGVSDIEAVESEDEVAWLDMEDVVNTQDTNGTNDFDGDEYPRPSSPLLRYTRQTDIVGAAGESSPSPPLSPYIDYNQHQDISFGNDYNNSFYSSSHNDTMYPTGNQENELGHYTARPGQPVQDYGTSVHEFVDDADTLGLDQSMELHHIDDTGFGVQHVDMVLAQDEPGGPGGIMVYSPSLSPQHPRTTRIPPPRMRSPMHKYAEVHQDVSLLSETSFTSPNISELPPPLDLTRYGFLKCNESGNSSGSSSAAQKQKTPFNLSLSSPMVLSESNTLEWQHVTTPKRNRARSRHNARNSASNQQWSGDPDTAVNNHSNGYDDSSDEPLPPERPKSAARTRSVAFRQPSAPVPTPVTLYQASFLNKADQYFASQSQTQGQVLDDEGAAETEQGYGKGRPRDTAGQSSTLRRPLSQAGTTTESLSATPLTGAVTPCDRNVKKSKTRADIRLEEMTRESARLASQYREQHEVPDYKSMTVARLRLAATKFGLKSTKKNVLVEQLTAIWHRLNPEPKPRPPTPPEEDDDQTPTPERPGLTAKWEVRNDEVEDDENDHDDIRWDEVMDESVGARSGEGTDKKGKGLAEEFEHIRRNRRFDASNILESDLDEDDSVLEEEKKSPFEGGDATDYDSEDTFDDGDDDDDDDDDDEYENEDEEDNEDASRSSSTGAGHRDDNDGGDRQDNNDQGHDLEDELQLPSLATSPTLERNLFIFLNSHAQFRRQLLIYQPLDLEVVWTECFERGIDCSRQELRKFLDKHGVICIVPAESKLSSWRKTRAKKQKRT
ncbi:hypothetical protein BG004_005197 [Podila humilis]|nr:hypothetical protein BG004_005197 [Podila humilis]